MSNDNSKNVLAVAALQNGTVIDHIPACSVFDVVRLLGIEKLDKVFAYILMKPSFEKGTEEVAPLSGSD